MLLYVELSNLVYDSFTNLTYANLTYSTLTYSTLT